MPLFSRDDLLFCDMYDWVEGRQQVWNWGLVGRMQGMAAMGRIRMERNRVLCKWNWMGRRGVDERVVGQSTYWYISQIHPQ